MGSFNPPHIGHIKVVNYLLKNKYVDKVLIVPTLAYWDKNDLASIQDRINMLNFFANDNVIIDAKHNECIYTYELVKEIEKEYPRDNLSIIIGADNVINLDKWKNYEELIKHHFIIMNRDNIDVYKYLNKKNDNFTVLDNYPYINISSTEIRNRLSNKYLDKRVLEYIKKHHLYDDYSELLANLDKVHTTKLGIERIKKNLKINDINVVSYLKEKIQKDNCVISKVGKNYYCKIENIIITINSYNYCIITAHKKDNSK